MKNFLLVFALSILLAGCGSNGSDAVQTASDLDEHAPTDIAETPVGTFACQTNADCAADEWCYATADFAACTKR